jgi:hypothetical protein
MAKRISKSPPRRKPKAIYQIIVFDTHANDWVILPDQEFAKEQDAETYVHNYPRFGGPYSRPFRAGNWQIILKQKEN